MTYEEPAAGPAERPLTTLLSDLASETTTLVRKEVELAKTELSEKAGEMGKGVAGLAAGGAVLFAGLLFLLGAVALGLAEVMAPWLAALIVGVAVTLVGLVLLQFGRQRLRAENLQPKRTLETLKDDTQWAKGQLGR